MRQTVLHKNWRSLMRVLSLFFGCVGLLGVTALAHPISVQAAEGTCQPKLLAHVPLRNDAGFLSSPVSIEGHSASMIIDTGSEGSLISPSGAEAFGLQLDPAINTVMQGTGGGQKVVPNVIVRSLQIGAARSGMFSIAVGSLPGKPPVQPPIEGLIGGDVLTHYDVEFNVAEGWMNLWAPTPAANAACGGPQGWNAIYRALPMQFDGRRVSIAVVLNGHTLKALVDSGARSRIVAQSVVARLGVSEQTLAADPGGLTNGVDGRQQAYHWHQFKTLQYGLEEEKNPVLTVAPLHDVADMLLGSDWFAAHRVWISYQTGKLYVMPARKR